MTFRSRRDLITIGEDMVNLAYDAPVDATPLSQIENAEQALYELAGTGKSPNTTLAGTDGASRARQGSARSLKVLAALAGLSTGFDELDNLMGGLLTPDLIILAGRPGMGKTALATSIARKVAHTENPVGFFLPGNVGRTTGHEDLAECAGVPSNDILRGKFTPEDLFACERWQQH